MKKMIRKEAFKAAIQTLAKDFIDEARIYLPEVIEDFKADGEPEPSLGDLVNSRLSDYWFDSFIDEIRDQVADEIMQQIA